MSSARRLDIRYTIDAPARFSKVGNAFKGVDGLNLNISVVPSWSFIWVSAHQKLHSLAPKEVGWFVPEPVGGRSAPQSNDVTLDERELIYLLIGTLGSTFWSVDKIECSHDTCRELQGRLNILGPRPHR